MNNFLIKVSLFSDGQFISRSKEYKMKLVQQRGGLEYEEVYEENNDIANYLLRQTRKQDMISSAEIKISRDSIKKCMKCYYLYLFILEYTRVEKLSNDTRFFNNFKSGIEYGNQTKG